MDKHLYQGQISEPQRELELRKLSGQLVGLVIS
jgi:hypothetical protein